ncbi:RING-box protein 2 [Oopsacas minuta]|uniref:RING-box protein 2 n=1 Tax=Oopsacas minuta TaxID=111878 RepID=A0AAV7JZA2_9METZ|nr:RING-box protein 2 [Oopsacas minuta]
MAEKMVVSTPNPSPQIKKKEKHQGPMFVLKRWNAVAMWSWDVSCDTCAICKHHVMDACLRCQTDGKQEECVVVWGECNHSYHNCCMALWMQHSDKCPLCSSDWIVSRTGK